MKKFFSLILVLMIMIMPCLGQAQKTDSSSQADKNLEELQEQLNQLTEELNRAMSSGNLKTIQALTQKMESISKKMLEAQQNALKSSGFELRPTEPCVNYDRQQELGIETTSLHCLPITVNVYNSIEVSNYQECLSAYGRTTTYLSGYYKLDYEVEQKGQLVFRDDLSYIAMTSPVTPDNSHVLPVRGMISDHAVPPPSNVRINHATGFSERFEESGCRKLKRDEHALLGVDPLAAGIQITAYDQVPGFDKPIFSFLPVVALAKSGYPDAQNMLEIWAGSEQQSPEDSNVVMTRAMLHELIKRKRLEKTFQWQTKSEETVSNNLLNIIIEITADKIASVVWEALDSPLDENPNSGGGKRIFPDKQTPSDVIDRKRVRVKATVTPPIEGVTVYFKAFDVDDPSSDAAPVDSNGSAGDDNRGAPNAGALSSLSATTNSLGEATVEFVVTMQPGDNFKIAASTKPNYLNSFSVDGMEIKAASGEKLPTKEAKATELLTVWRKLHIEVDSMGKVTGNEVSGNIINLAPPMSAAATSVWVLPDFTDLSDNLDSKPPAKGRFEKGTLTVAGTTVINKLGGNGNLRLERAAGMNVTATPLPFTAIAPPSSGFVFSGTVTEIGETSDDEWLLDLKVADKNAIDWPAFTGGMLSIGGGPPMTITEVFPDLASVKVSTLKIPVILKDDDQITGNVLQPDTGFLGPAFAPAYVLPVFDVGDNNTNVPFVLNLETSDEQKLVQEVFDFDAKGTEADSDFWTIYLLGAYQPREEDDGDPNSEDVISGLRISSLGAVIFMEVITEIIPTALVNNATVVAHEVGHLFFGEHEDLGLMSNIEELSSTAFSDVTLNKIRSIVHP